MIVRECVPPQEVSWYDLELSVLLKNRWRWEEPKTETGVFGLHHLTHVTLVKEKRLNGKCSQLKVALDKIILHLFIYIKISFPLVFCETESFLYGTTQPKIALPFDISVYKPKERHKCLCLFSHLLCSKCLITPCVLPGKKARRCNTRVGLS